MVAAACGGVVDASGNSAMCETPTGSSSGTSAPAPAPLGTRLQELDACKSRTSDAIATFGPQRVPAGSMVAYFRIDGDARAPFANPASCAAPAEQAIGAVRAIASGDPSDPRTAVRLYTDACGLAPIRAESGWYEGWLVSDLVVPEVGRITQADADALARMGDGENRVGRVFTTDGRAPRAADKEASGNTLAVVVSIGTWNALEGGDAHAFFTLDPSSSWSPPSYEWLATGGVVAPFVRASQYAPLGDIGALVDSRVPGSGPSGVLHLDHDGKLRFGDDPASPRDPDRRVCATTNAAERRVRAVPSGVAREILYDAFLRPASFEPDVTDIAKRLLDAYAHEVRTLDADRDGVISPDEASPSNALPLTAFDRVVVTREINDGLLSMRFAPTVAPAVVLSGAASYADVSIVDAGAPARQDGGDPRGPDPLVKGGGGRYPR